MGCPHQFPIFLALCVMASQMKGGGSRVPPAWGCLYSEVTFLQLCPPGCRRAGNRCIYPFFLLGYSTADSTQIAALMETIFHESICTWIRVLRAVGPFLNQKATPTSGQFQEQGKTVNGK